MNELCVFAVDDDEGRINGIAPGAEGYTRVALERSRVIFSSIAKLPKGFKNDDLKNILEFESGTKLRFYLISNSTTQAVLSGKTSFSSVVFSSATNNNTAEEGFSLNFQNFTVTVQATEEEVSLGTGLQGKYQGELIDLRSVTQLVTAEFAVNREASYNNFVGFYQVADENGGIDTSASIRWLMRMVVLTPMVMAQQIFSLARLVTLKPLCVGVLQVLIWRWTTKVLQIILALLGRILCLHHLLLSMVNPMLFSMAMAIRRFTSHSWVLTQIR